MNKTNIALVTGGGSGIGRELCRRFIRDGYRLVIVSLLENELAWVKAELLAERADADILTLQQGLSLVDAGFGLWGEHLGILHERVKSMLLRNMTTLCTKFGADMQADGAGRILNIGSTTSFQPLPS